MKKTFYILFLYTLCTGMMFAASLHVNSNKNDDPQYKDKIEMSRIGGSTRAVGEEMGVMSASVSEVVIDAHNLQELVAIQVQNYRGGVWVEVIGSRGARRTYFQAYEIGFGVVLLGDLRPGNYTLRVTLESGVYEGSFNKRTYGR